MNDLAPSFDRTWRCADGELVYGEFAFVTDLEFFDDLDEPIELIEETWQRTAVRSVWRFPNHAGCDGDGEDDIECAGDDDWVQGQYGWMHLCAAHREHLANLDSVAAGVPVDPTPREEP